ncbi:nucleotidyltransferase family protein [Fulvivirgaceae bacterium PWU4]|uniref:Nucleotidyltransferase family protein n=1 Tax=Chryseosolibacter histidini TaxID=2782349 RepID=A0AAP2DKX2_9BACT|nr:nucleotidyltransferase family protein [Chryseosolibacter histidini]MBT1698225.1 nucleotidyltransferase family protein [Chryseosolibacter histidini]
MLTKEEILKRLREHKTELQRKFPLKSLALFGSYARNEQTDTSDIDVLVEFSEPVGFEFIDLIEELERLFNHKIDLVSKKGVKSHYLPYIEDDAIYV